MSARTLPPIHGLHHNAWRCSDAERTRRFYEDLLGLPLTDAIELEQSKTGRPVHALHLFFALGDGSSLAFFDVPGMPFDFKAQHDFDLHIALEVAADSLPVMMARAQDAGVQVRGISDHGFIHSIYLRDPDGYVVELTAPANPPVPPKAQATVRNTLRNWQARKTTSAAPIHTGA